MKLRRKGSLSHLVLTVLEKTIDGYVRLDDFVNNPGFYAYYDGWDRPLKKSRLAQAIKRLKEQGLLEEVKIRDDLILKLSTQGKDLVFIEDNCQSWDGKWRIVVFDIPEQKRLVRDLFRRNLKKWGFKPMQKSVWISKRDVFGKLTGYIKELEIERWVSVIEADKISSHNNT